MLLAIITSCRKENDLLDCYPIEGVYIRNEAGAIMDSWGKTDV
jgi:hypothetical protein